MLATSFAAGDKGHAPRFPPAIPSAPQSTSLAQKARVTEAYGKLPLSFESNVGQADGNVNFLSRGSGYALYLTASGAEFALCGAGSGAVRRDLREKPVTRQKANSCEVVGMRLEGAPRRVIAAGQQRLPGALNYFIGKDPAKWRTNVPIYAKVRYANVYHGVDLIYHGDQRQLEFDFIVAPGADPRAIRLRFDATNRLRVAANGDLVVTSASGKVAFHKPLAYQMVDGRREAVAGSFILARKQTVGFGLAKYDRAKTLVIDPVLAYSTFLGGSGELIQAANQGHGIAVDAAGNTYVTGQTSSTSFPVTPGAFQTSNKAAYPGATAFVTKMNATGTALVYSTYLGGSGGDEGTTVAVDSTGNAYVTGETFSTNFPVTQGAFQTNNNGAANGVGNGFVTKLNPTGAALVYSTYLGGSGLAASAPYGGDEGNAIAVDAAGNVYVAGKTFSVDFPVTPGAFQTTNNAAANEESNAFITELNAGGSALVYSTYLGGTGGVDSGETCDGANGIALDTADAAYVTGQACSDNFPVTAGALQTTNRAGANRNSNAFITKLNSTGTALAYSTYLGGSIADTGSAIAVDSVGDAYVGGSTSSSDFPVTPGAFQTTNNGATSTYTVSNGFVSKFNATGTSLMFSTFLGGSGGTINLSPTLLMNGGDQVSGLAIDSSDNVYVTGSTASANFPVTQGAFQTANNDQPPCPGGCIGGYNAFATELNPTGSALVSSTYLGGNGINPIDYAGVVLYGYGDEANALALDSAGNVYVTGSATSYDFPLTAGAFQTTILSSASAFVSKIDMSANSTAATPTVTVTPAASTITSAQPITVTISVAGPSGAATPTGTVTLASGTYVSPATTLSGGSATIDIPGGSLLPDEAVACGYPPSPDLLAAGYVPDAASSSTYKSSSGLGSVDVVAPCIAVTPSLTTISSAQAQSQPFSLAIAATGGAGNPVPTGTVTLTTGSYISAATTLSAGNATIIIPAGTLIVGSNNLTISYSGDSNYARYPLASLAIVDVTAGSGTPSFTVTGTPVTVEAGATSGNTSNIAVTSTGGFGGAVTLTAAVTSGPTGAQYPPTFSFTPSSTVIVGVNPGTATLSISTTPAAGCAQAGQAPLKITWYAGGGAVFACLLLFGIEARRRRWRTAFTMLALLAIFAGGLLGCGGNAASTRCSSVANGTTPGGYAITVTGTSGNTTAAGTLTLTVQ